MSKIIGNTTVTPVPRSDWSQTDETKIDYIRNKPEIITADSTLTQSGQAADAKVTGDAINYLQENIDLKGDVKTVNGIAPDESGDVELAIDLDEYYTKTEIDNIAEQKSQVQIITWEADD